MAMDGLPAAIRTPALPTSRPTPLPNPSLPPLVPPSSFTSGSTSASSPAAVVAMVLSFSRPLSPLHRRDASTSSTVDRIVVCNFRLEPGTSAVPDCHHLHPRVPPTARAGALLATLCIAPGRAPRVSRHSLVAPMCPRVPAPPLLSAATCTVTATARRPPPPPWLVAPPPPAVADHPAVARCVASISAPALARPQPG
nr:zinc finger protein ZIC 5-like [Aegilops tauschii subsp. strangulata]